MSIWGQEPERGGGVGAAWGGGAWGGGGGDRIVGLELGFVAFFVE